MCFPNNVSSGPDGSVARKHLTMLCSCLGLEFAQMRGLGRLQPMRGRKATSSDVCVVRSHDFAMPKMISDFGWLWNDRRIPRGCTSPSKNGNEIERLESEVKRASVRRLSSSIRT
jgi:hypothetical protein